jgi:hypothetical protein
MGYLSIELKGKPEDVLKRAEELAQNKGVQFEHDGQSGSFSYLVVKGTFKITENLIEIEYTKPPFVPDSMVEEQIKQVFSA